MIVYIIYIFSILLLSVSEILGNRNRHKYLFIWISFLTLLFVGLRQTGFDYDSYNRLYHLVKSGEIENLNIEYGYIILMSCSPSYSMLLFITALFTIGTNYTAIFKMSKYPIFSLLIVSTTLLLPTYMGQIRQSIAIGFGLLSFYYIVNRKKKISILCVLFAAFFHISSLFLLVMYMVDDKYRSLKFYVWGLILSIAVGKAMEFLIGPLIEYLPNESIMSTKVAYYNDTEDFTLGFAWASLIRVTIFLLAFRYIKDPKDRYLVNLYYCSLLIYYCFSAIPQIGTRACLYFTCLDVIIIPSIIYSVKNIGWIYLNLIFVFVLLSIMRYISFFISPYNYEEYVPYLKGVLN